MEIEIYSDGSATTSDKPGGYGWVMIIDKEKHSEGSGYVEFATNNDMELLGSIEGLSAVATHLHKLGLPVLENPEMGFGIKTTLCSDSQIVLGWADGSYRFKQEDKLDKYNELKKYMKALRAKTRWIKGHSGDTHNERCDVLANLARKKMIEDLSPKVDPGLTLIGDKKSNTVSLWYSGQLFVLDFEQKIMEAYSKDLHGKRGSVIEIREGKER